MFEIVSPFILKFSTFTLPVPLVLSSKSALESIVWITLLSILILSVCNSLVNTVFHLFVAVPKSYKLSTAGLRSEPIPAVI